MFSTRNEANHVIAVLLMLFLLVGCAGKKGLYYGEPPAPIPSESVSDEYVVEEETFETPATIEEQELEAIRSLKASAEQEGALEDILFDFNVYTLGKKSQEQLQRTAQWLQNNPTVNVMIEGHCDERGSQEYNLALGELRAVAVQKYLRSLGVGVERMGTVSYGEERPLDPASNEEAWAKNRRAHFDITSR